MGNKEYINSVSAEKSIEVPNRFQVALYSGKQHRNFFRSIYPHSYIGSTLAAAVGFSVGVCIAPRRALIVNDDNIRGALKHNPDNPPLLGDRSLAAEPREFTEKLCADVRRGGTERLLDTRVGKMTNYILTHLEKRQRPDEDAKQYFGDYLESVLFDYDRRQERRILKAEELDKYYFRTNNGWYNTYLVLAKAHFRTDNLPDFNRQTGWLDAANDLYDDWKKGNINIPQEVLEDAGVGVDEDIAEVELSPTITEWRRDTASDAVKSLKLVVYDLKYGMRGDRRVRSSLNRDARHRIEKADNYNYLNPGS